MTDIAQSRLLTLTDAWPRLRGLVWLLPWVMAAGFFWPPLNGDVSAILYGAQRMLAGQVLYRDVLDPNPPTLFVASLLPAAAARWLGGGAQLWSVGFALGWIAVCLGVAGRIIRLPALSAGGVVLAALFVPADQFGQREHLFILGLTPWLACAVRRLEGGRITPGLALWAGGLGAMGTVIKPYFLLLPLVVELLLQIHGARRRWDGERLGLLIGLVLCGGGLMAAYPDYIRVILPFSLAHYIGLDHGGIAAVLLEEGRWPLLLALLFVPFGLIQRRDRIWAVASAGFLAALAIAIIQGKGWYYHLIPAWLILCATAAIILGRLAGRWRGVVLLVWLAALMVIDPYAGQRAYAESPAARLSELLRSFPPEQRTVMFLTSTIYPQYPAIPVAGAVQTMPWLNLWVLDSLYRDGTTTPRPLAAMSRDELALLSATAQGMLLGRPSLLFTAPVGLAEIEPLAWLAQFPGVAQALGDYRPITDLPGIPEGVRLWQRMTAQ